MSRTAWISWSQPVLTSNTDYGTCSASSTNSASTPAWKASDGSHEGNATSWESGKAVIPASWKWVLPQPIRISEILLYNKYTGSTNVTKDVQVFADEEMTIPIGTAQVFEASSFSTVTITPDTPVETDTIFIYCSSSHGTAGNNYVGLGEVVITAEIQSTQYEATFQDWDGTLLKTDWVDKGGTAVPPDAPTRTGYTFAGWDLPLENINADTVFTAQYRTEGTYQVVFKNYDATVLKTELVLAGNSATAPDVPDREGYNFTGWDVPFNNVHSDIVTTAQFALKVHHTVRFLDWDDTLLKTETVEDGYGATAPDPPQRAGYQFTGWHPPYSEITSDLDVFAQYEQLIYYTVRYLDWDDTELKTEQVLKGGTATPPSNPTRSGYTFTGWQPSTFTNINADTDFTAQYDIIIIYHIVSFYSDGVLIAAVQVEDGEAAIPPLPPQKEGYIFDHWDADFTAVTADMSANAVFREALDHTVILVYSASGTLLQTIDRVLSATLRDSLDGELTFDFSTLAARGQSIMPGCVAEYDGCFFNIVRVTRSISAGMMVTSVTCEHISYVLNDDRYRIDTFDFTGEPADGMALLLAGTQFSPGVIEYSGSVTMQINTEVTRRAALMQFIALMDGEIEYDGHLINVRAHRGSTAVKQLLESKNVTDVSVTYESRIATASYEVAFHKVADCAVGDEVHIHFSPLGVDTETRIIAMEYNPFYRYNIRVEVGDYKPTINDSLYNIEKSAADTNEEISDIRDSMESIDADYQEFQTDYDNFLNTYKEVTNIVIAENTFTVTFFDDSTLVYNYSVNDEGRMTSITKREG